MTWAPKLHRITVIGGSFDPPHIGHQTLALFAKEHSDEVWVVPCGDRDDKHTLSPGALRLEMTQAAFPDCRVLDIEVQNGQMIPTYFLMKQLEQQDRFVQFLLATDLLPTLEDWDEGPRLIAEVNFLVVPRPGFQLDSDTHDQFQSRKNFCFVNSAVESMDISSTWVRDAVKRLSDPAAIRRELAGKVDPAVLDIILGNNLYV